MESAPVFASTAATAGLPPIPTPEQANAIAYGHTNLAATADAVKQASAWVEPLRREVGRVIIGQKYLVDRLLIALVANGHVLLEGVPGLAKTLALRTLAATIQLRFQRIQFTPDMLPADIIGTQIYNPRDGTFNPKLGPIFANFVLADEINRAPAKVQSALLEAMQERQVTLGENTYALPEAQVDRFMLKVVVHYPSRAEERGILDTMATTTPNLAVQPVVAPARLMQVRGVINAIHVDDKVRDYIVDVVVATREPKTYGLDFPGWIQYGASPRATISLALAARAFAFLNGRAYVTPQDVKDVAHDVLQHRVAVTYEAEAENLTSRDIVQKILDTLPVP